MGEVNVDVVVGLDLFNTHGTEITPGSNVVVKHFECDWFGHMTPGLLY